MPSNTRAATLEGMKEDIMIGLMLFTTRPMKSKTRRAMIRDTRKSLANLHRWCFPAARSIYLNNQTMQSVSTAIATADNATDGPTELKEMSIVNKSGVLMMSRSLLFAVADIRDGSVNFMRTGMAVGIDSYLPDKSKIYSNAPYDQA